MSHPRIVVVGGGSQFAIGLCESLVDYAADHLAGAHVVLLDVRDDHLGTVSSFATALARAVKAPITFEASLDQRHAFAGADYILTTFRPGTHEQQEQDERVPPKFGLQGNETVGIGGIFMACRIAPTLRSICADAQELCPDAWIVNYTNPTQHVAEVVHRLGGPRIISLCDGFVDVVDDLAFLLEVDPAEIELFVAGTNHAMWVVRFTISGEDGYPVLRNLVDSLSEADLAERFRPPDRVEILDVEYNYDVVYKQFVRHHCFPFSLRLFRLFGMLPGPRYYWRYLLDQDDIVVAQQSGKYVSMAGFYMEHMEPRLFADLAERMSRHISLRSSRREGGGGHADLAVRLIGAMASGRGENFVVNIRNEGAVANLPSDAVLELSAAVDRHGCHAYAVGELPDAMLGLQMSLVLSQKLAVAAALSGKREDLLRSIVAHPLIHSLDGAEACMDEMLSLRRDWLPQFTAA